MSENSKTADDRPEVALSVMEVEAKEIAEFFRSYTTVLIQVATALAIADVTIVGVGLANRLALAFWLGAACTLILQQIWVTSFRSIVPLYYRGVMLEHMLRQVVEPNYRTIVSTGILALHGPKVLLRLQMMASLNDEVAIARELVALSRDLAFRKFPSAIVTLVFILSTVLQVALGFLAIWWGWSIF